MATYLHLLDPKTSEKLAPATIVDQFRTQAKFASAGLVESLLTQVKSQPPEQAIQTLAGRRRDLLKGNNVQGAVAAQDAMTLLQLQIDIAAAQAQGKPRHEVDFDVLRNSVLQKAHQQEAVQRQRDAEKQRADAAARETLRQESLAPLQTAIEEIVSANANDKNYQRIARIFEPFMKQGYTLEATRTELLKKRAEVGGFGFTGESWEYATALKVVDRAEALLTEKGVVKDAGRDFSLKAAAANMLDIRGVTDTRSAMQVAMGELQATGAYKQLSQPLMESIAATLDAKHATIADSAALAKLLAELDEKAKKKEGDFAGRDHLFARDFLIRGHDLLKASIDARTNKTALSVDRLSGLTQMGQYMIVRAAELASVGMAEVPVATAPAPATTATPDTIGGGRGITGTSRDPALRTAGADASAEVTDDDKPYGPYQGKEYAATSTPRGKLREAQLCLQLLDADTGAKNCECIAKGSLKASDMDGICGPKTDAAIRKFQKENKLPEDGKLNEATMAALQEKGKVRLAQMEQEREAARVAAAGAGAGTGPAATTGATAGAGAAAAGGAARPPAEVANAPIDLKTQFAAELAKAKDVDASPKKYGAGLVNDAFIKSEYIAKMRRIGIELTPEEKNEVNVTKGIISSAQIARLETALGLHADGKMDEQLSTVLDSVEVQRAVAQAFRNSRVTGGAAVAGAGGSGNVPAGAAGANPQRGG